MKNYLLILVLFVLTINVNANTNPTTKSNCRLDKAGLVFFNAPTTFVENDLLQGIWTKEITNEQTGLTVKYTYQFNDFGVLDIIANDNAGVVSAEKSFWRIEEFNESVFLVLTDMNKMKDNLYEVEPTCEGIVLTDVSNDQASVLAYSNAVSAKGVKKIQKMITGKWVNTSYPYDMITDVADFGSFEEMENAYLKYQFKKDGTYVKLIGSEMVEVLERGFWEISKDGNNILFYASEDGTPEKISRTEFAKIVKVDDHSLKIEFAHRTNEFSDLFNTSLKEFSFNRK